MSKKQDYTFQTYLECVNRTWKHDTEEKESAHLKWALLEEPGEFCGWMKKIEGYGKERDSAINYEILAELGDAIYFIVKQISKILPDNAQAEFAKEEDLKKFAESNTYNIVLTYYKYAIEGDLANCQLTLQTLILNQGFTLQEVLHANVAKLKARHGDKFRDSSTTEGGRNRQMELDEMIEAVKNDK